MTLSRGQLRSLSLDDAEIGAIASPFLTTPVKSALPASTPVHREPVCSETAAGESRDLRWGLVLYAICTICSAGMSILAKLAASQGIPVFEIVLVRSAMVASIAYSKIMHSAHSCRGGGSIAAVTHTSIWGRRRWLLLVRGLLGFGAGSCLYWSVVLLPLSAGLVLTSFAPLLVALLSPCLIREVPSRTVMAGIPFCIAGVVMVARPTFIFGGGAGLLPLGVAVAVVQCIFSALVKIIVRELRTTEDTNVIVLYLGFLSSVGAALACTVSGFVVPGSMAAFAALFGTGMMGYGSQLTMTMALRRVKAAPATAMSYLSVVWGILGGLVIFGESLQLWSVLGAAMICGSTLAVALLEQRRVALEHGSEQGLGQSGGYSAPHRAIMLSETAAGKA